MTKGNRRDTVIVNLSLACSVAVLFLSFGALAFAQKGQGRNVTAIPADTYIRKLLDKRVKTLSTESNRIGIVVGVIEPKGTRIISSGRRGKDDTRPFDGDTAFEIGSVTKVFTALLLADMVLSGEVALDDPVAKHLPLDIKVPTRKGRSITLLDLATHTSGLPIMPDELPPFGQAPETVVGKSRMSKFVGGYHLTRDIGAVWDYSNVGYWLLGEALAFRAGTDFESLMRKRVIIPLKLKNTRLTLSRELKARLAVGHNAVLQPAPFFSSVGVSGELAAAGGLISTADDMLRLLAAAMDYERSTLAPALATVLRTRRPMPEPGYEQALGWVVMGSGDDQLIVHEGGTWGFVSYLAWDPKRRAGVVVLSNQMAGVGDIARYLLRPDVPLTQPTVKKRTEVAIDKAPLDAYVGTYDAGDDEIFVIARQEDFLTIRLPSSWGLPKLRLRPESSREFFVAEFPVSVTFQPNSYGRNDEILVMPPQRRRGIPAKRI